MLHFREFDHACVDARCSVCLWVVLLIIETCLGFLDGPIIKKLLPDVFGVVLICVVLIC